jgi:hypothetical protein
MQQMIKDQMDKKFGSPWHVIVGKGFAYEITYEVSKWMDGVLCTRHEQLLRAGRLPVQLVFMNIPVELQPALVCFVEILINLSCISVPARRLGIGSIRSAFGDWSRMYVC